METDVGGTSWMRYERDTSTCGAGGDCGRKWHIILPSEPLNHSPRLAVGDTGGKRILAEAMHRYSQVPAHDDWQPYVIAAIDTALAAANRAGQEAMRERCAKIAGAASLIPVPGTGDCNHVGQVIYDTNMAKIAQDIRALPVE